VLLVALRLPPAIIYTRDRTRYLRALRRADAGDPGPLGGLITRAVTDNFYGFVVPAVAGPNLLVPLASLASREYSLVSLRVALERGWLKGQQNPRSARSRALGREPPAGKIGPGRTVAAVLEVGRPAGLDHKLLQHPSGNPHRLGRRLTGRPQPALGLSNFHCAIIDPWQRPGDGQPPVGTGRGGCPSLALGPIQIGPRASPGI
jgi:hypothetical protein